MKKVVLLLAAATALTVAGAASAHEMTVDRGSLDKLFQEMGRMTDGLPQMHGAARRGAARNHMRLLQEQMGAMHGMQSGHGGPMMGQGMPQGSQSGPDLQGRMGSMDQRMDTMQKMMEQMLKQQELLLEDEAG